jgi:hypothetical protein
VEESLERERNVNRENQKMTSQYHKDWVKNHKENVREASARWRKRNPSYPKDYYQKHGEERIQYGRDYRKKQKEMKMLLKSRLKGLD